MPLGLLQRYAAFGGLVPLPPQALPGRMTRRALAMLVLVGLVGGCQGANPQARQGQARCSAQVASEAQGLLRPLRYGFCLLSINAVLERERAEAQIRQQAAARQQLAACVANQADVKGLALALLAAQERLAQLGAEPYGGSERPKRLDPNLQRRFATYDQELDQERYETALAQWQQAESERYQGWLVGRNRRMGEERTHLAALARRLNQLNPQLFAAPGSLAPLPRLNRQAYGLAITCQPERLR